MTYQTLYILKGRDSTHNNLSQGIVDERVNGSKTMQMQCFPFYTLLLAIGNPTIDFLSLDIEVSFTGLRTLI